MSNMRNATLDEIRAMKDRGEIRPSTDDAETVNLPDDFWETATLVQRENKRSIHLRVDEDVYRFFKAQGRGHLTRMNEVLRTYVEAQKPKP